MRRIVLGFFLLLISFNSERAFAGTVTMPSTLTTDTTDFVLLSSSGTTPSISGYTGTLLLSAVASDGNIKVTSVTSLMRAAGYCSYTNDNANEPSNCTGSSLTEIGFRGTQDNINNALATLSFKGDGTAGSPTITVSVTPVGTNYFSGNGHYYEIVQSNGIDWDDAKTAAEASTYEGLTGYLVTITSAAENSFVSGKINKNAWMGASDNSSYTSNTHATTEGTWEWVSGPENGKTFTCQPAGQGRGAVAAHEDCEVHSDTTYENWDGSEPNDCCDSGIENIGDEDYLHIKANGKWNDYDIDTTVNYYIIEYGGMPGETATSTGQTTLTINSTEASDSTYNAFDDKQVKGMVDAQTEHAKRFMFNTTNQVMRRMEQFRRVGINKSTSIKDVRLVLADKQNNFKDHIPPELLNYYIDEYKNLSTENINNLISELPLSKYLKENFGITKNNWAFWTAGSINKGRLSFGTDNDLGITNRTEGYIIGTDVNYNDGSLFGIAFRHEDDRTNLGTKDSTRFLARSDSISLYNTWHGSEKNFIDSFLGYGETTYDTTRLVDTSNPSNVVKGEFKANQIFTSIKYNFKHFYKNLKIHNYSRFDFGFVDFDGYSETGDSNSKLKFDGRYLQTSSISLGSAIEREINLPTSLFIPYLKVDFNKDLTDGSDIKANFVGETTKYNTTIDKNFNSMFILETGFDWVFRDGWNIKSVISRLDKNGFGHENMFELRAVKSTQSLY